MKTKNTICAAALFLTATFFSAQSQKSSFSLDLNGASTGIKIQPTMYGIFFEDINFAADGGLYAELIKNRSFEFDEPLTGWKQPNTKTLSPNLDSGFLTIITDKSKSNRNYARITVWNDKNYLLENEGFRGIGLHQGEKYDLSFNLENVSGNISAINISLVDEKGTVVSSVSNIIKGGGWQKYNAVFNPSKTIEKAKLQITFTGKGVVNMDMISLFPQDTWRGRKGGLRKDLVQKLYDLQPGFLRFPGGCIVEGRTLAERYQWKKTIGKVEDRENLINKWNNGFAHRLTPDYWQSFGLGFFEYFQLAEDLGAEPLPILSCGMACQFNTAELVKMEDLNPYVQDALDLIEFANGDSHTKWGKIRAEMGHPQPFNMKFIGVGNEQWGADYIERYKVFEKAIHTKYPDIKIVSGSGPSPDGDFFDYGWKELKKLNAQIVDEHYYNSPEWFMKNAGRYDTYDRSGPKVFAGEYAAQSVGVVKPDNKNSWLTALSEAAFMTGLERNADVVTMTSYAPLFAHAEGWQWTPDLIWFNNLKSYATPNYYVQKLFSNNKGTEVLKITGNGKPVTGHDQLYATAVKDAKTRETIIKIVNTDAESKSVTINPESLKLGNRLTKITLTAPQLSTENSFENEPIQPKEETLSLKKGKVVVDIPSQSLVILKIN
ncbi:MULTISPECIES: alpha-L-arabinofuranosidase C-terminal domain-containing protein [Chryseobacterium]|uniref:non-reducing end alpha-L-arabinofuranosidase n=1 Tax=Chryseobacterium camelliae TaxID=1265445 RepID=A0ABU0TGA0_9FLAO|nr:MULTISPECIES: alpha-L-arabinofuranosidase C-terminal domain-containing protein [Chryseobacterium]MDT3406115.1 alpha-N-arabinofuranosidase [Pseudacidovorax intermedius]MDQ1096083.1 alpha-N-arabinofuranosidase [Chryseobacterium camelliae]MDQ1100019.1 alpha-N-arabinofuranosidase [Chryseobacterium sp. SORGH_AS_1048]MDR6087363.1 alpha-N-arabinofuranosidase [Chryseobacterium sp. SORGH_AS_0909]MDR6131738.1 alpha-N-arabinofuranosidase [Chryseobacterium sp. SORGH_AS_1175]